jgi:hypothetical protein
MFALIGGEKNTRNNNDLDRFYAPAARLSQIGGMTAGNGPLTLHRSLTRPWHFK